MSRPKPKILLNYTDPKTFQSEQVLAISAIYVLFYNGQPVNLKSVNSLLSYPNPKYRRTAFPENPGHAFNLADRLNTLFKTDKFEVYRFVNEGVRVTRKPQA
jgi:hypothetical protein